MADDILEQLVLAACDSTDGTFQNFNRNIGFNNCKKLFHLRAELLHFEDSIEVGMVRLLDFVNVFHVWVVLLVISVDNFML